MLNAELMKVQRTMVHRAECFPMLVEALEELLSTFDVNSGRAPSLESKILAARYALARARAGE